MPKQDYTDKEIKHLEMIESVIERMGQNSFALKGWTMTLIFAICAFSAAGTERKFAIVAVSLRRSFTPKSLENIEFSRLFAFYFPLSHGGRRIHDPLQGQKRKMFLTAENF